MKITRWMVRVVALMLVASCGLTPIAHAQIEGGSELAPAEGAERWWGVAGAAICGGELWLVRTKIFRFG